MLVIMGNKYVLPREQWKLKISQNVRPSARKVQLEKIQTKNAFYCSLDQPVDEVVEVSQDSPQSNAIHIAHNIPKGSDISVKLTNPYNVTVHISLNVASDCKVKVEMSQVVNCALHISLNGAKNSMVEATVDNAFNSTVHLRYSALCSIDDEVLISRLKSLREYN